MKHLKHIFENSNYLEERRNIEEYFYEITDEYEEVKINWNGLESNPDKSKDDVWDGEVSIPHHFEDGSGLNELTSYISILQKSKQCIERLSKEGLISQWEFHPENSPSAMNDRVYYFNILFDIKRD
jgi:hypothetical protein